jgi:hypothetical protein
MKVRGSSVLQLSVIRQEQSIAFQICIVPSPSSDPEAIKLPSSEKHMQVTPPEWNLGLS